MLDKIKYPSIFGHPRESLSRTRGNDHQCKSTWNIRIPQPHFIMSVILIASLYTNFAQAQSAGGYLDGIGYREQEYAVAKGSFFQSEAPIGVKYASFGGGTHIFIKGIGLADNPQSNTVVLYSEELTMSVTSTPLTEDDSFNSHPMLGTIAYRLPAIDVLFGIPMNFLDQYQQMNFYLSVISTSELGSETLECQTKANCLIQFKKTHTPVVYYLSPPVVYYSSFTEVWFDPKNVPNLIQELSSDEMQFINAKIGGSLLDFEFNVDDTTTFSSYYRNKAMGQIGELAIGESHDISMQWETGQAFVLRQESTHCSYDNSTCYQARAVPVIFETSSKIGYTSGGMNLTVTGFGFDYGVIDAKVDGQDCEVTDQSTYSFSCQVATKAAVSVTNTSTVGSYGLKRFFINETNWLSWGNFHLYNQTQKLAMTMSSPYNEGDMIGNIFKGWFVAPASTNYRFYIACDDYCDLSLGTTSMEAKSPTKLVSSTYNTDYRDWWETRGTNNKRISDWVTLTAGEYYYIEANHLEGTGGDFFTAAVEIEKSNAAGHHHAMKEVQYLSVQTDQVFELTRISITDMDDGEFLLVFQNPNDQKLTKSTVITASGSASQLKSAIQDYYRLNSFIRSNIQTNETWYDVNGTETTNQTEAVQRVYYIQLLKLITGSSASSITVVKTTSKATIVVDLPSVVQLSALPLSGNYRIKCVAPDGSVSYSQDVVYSYSDNWVNNQISNGCDRLYDLTEVTRGNDYAYAENGVSWILRFIGLNEDPGQFEIVQSETKPLTAGDGNVTFFSNTTIPYGTNLFFEAIPFEMLRTYETEPQLIVSVGNLPAVCHNLTCDFTYILPVGEVTAFSFVDSTKKLVLTGTNIPSVIANISKVEFALVNCIVDESTLSATNLECILEKEPTCGDHLPILTSLLGLIPNAASLTAKTISCSISAVAPSTGLNLLGGDNITISGTYLPHTLETSTVSLKFSDAQQTICVPQISSTSTLVCLTSPFDEGVSAGQTLSMTIVINQQTVTNTLSLTMKADIKSSITITPSSVSPVLKTNITVQLGTDFPYTIVKEDFSINATDTTNSSYVRYLNVIKVDDAAKTFVAIFGGAESGTFQINIRHAQYGLVGTDGLILDVSSSVTSYTPMTGSIYGGTLLTITGTNFGTVFTDNPVQISNNGGVGSIDCFVQEISSTQIKCRIDSGLTKTGGDIDTIVVFLKTSEEAVCDPTSKCVYTWTASLPKVTSAAVQFDTTGYQWQLKVSGTGFTGDTSSVELLIADVLQTTASVSSTEAIFTITNVSSQTLSSQKLYFDVGIPESHSIVQASMTLTPKFVSISPNSGSIGGSLITAVVPGAGSSATIVDSTGASICSTVKLTAYGVIECKTLAKVITANQLSIKQGTITYACVNADTSLCQYEQSSTASFPAVDSVTQTDSTIVFTGTNLDLAQFTSSATFFGIAATSVVIDSATQATATFSLGVPIAAEAPVLVFTKGSVVHYAPSASILTHTLAVSNSISGLQCSYAGGCSFEVTSTGLASMILSNQTKNYVSICDEKCLFDESTSSATVAKCKIPRLSTVYSNENFEISTPSENLKSGNYFGTASNYLVAFDNMVLVKPIDTSTTCNLGMKFKEGHVAVLSQVKYFMKDISSKSLFVNTTSFQGSNDGTTYTTLFQMDDNLHEGWNYHQWPLAANQPKYRYYRFHATAKGACAINEITFTGVETIDDSASSHTCSAKLVTGATETSLNTILYKGSLTGTLDSISPRFGTVVGGTSVTFTGTSFTTDTTKYTITIDGINCPVSAASLTSVTCTTGKRPGLIESSLEIYIAGQGLVSNRELLFRYVSVWSSDTTWGGEFAPMEDESVYIPKGLNLLVDVDSTPRLNAVIVEGSLIFAPDADSTHQRFFDAKYIFINEGLMEVGTEDFRYTSKITITMHGSAADPYLPTYGNKVIGLRQGTLDMHGPVRTPTWTMLETTVLPGSDTITLQVAVDWQVGEIISIASTSYESREAEKRTITAIDSTMKIITLDKVLEFKHFAATETYGDQTIDMRAEVGLLSRNVVFRGDPETSLDNEYGATIFMHSQGDDSLTARLSYFECTDVGQAFKVGRYAIHFHMIGAVHNSYAKGISVHQGFNRAFTLHGTHYLRLTENVAYNIKGHTIFIEDAVETNNYIYKNLVMMTVRSMSLLNTDQTPACFWITHPDNIFIDNHAAGSDRYGFWYDLQTHPTGPSSDTNVCPENHKVGEFRGNSAHSMGRYGLRIFHNMVPRQYPCKPIVYDANVPENPYWQNLPITANFDDFTGWKCNRNGAIAERMGDVHFNNFKTADNLLAGIEFSLTAEYGDDYAQINGALVVGRSSNTEELLDLSSPHGIITPRTENFQVKNVKFYNFNWNDAAALGSCSHCFHPASTDSGARTVTFSGLEFDTSVTKKIKYQYPFKAIYYDLDGSLTGKGAKTWATHYYKHHEQPECEHLENEFGGVTCTSDIQIRRIAFWNTSPKDLFSGMGFKVLKYDDSEVGAMDNDTKSAYLLDKDNYSTILYKGKQDPADGWATPFVTGHKYKVHWGQTGIDFEQLQLTMSQRWEDTDKPIYLVHNFTDVRQAVEVRLDGVLIDNNTIPSSDSAYQAGHNLILNDTATREVHLIINGLNQGSQPLKESNLILKGVRCVGSCVEVIVEVATESEFRYWSDITNWPNNVLPQAGEDVHILSGWNMILDIEETPILKLIRVNGILSFSEDMDVHLQAKHIYVRAGELHIGNETNPYQNNAKITLYGEKNEESIFYDNAIEGGNKVIANVGTVKMFGKSRTKKMTRLTQEANKGDTKIYVETGLDLVQGDQIALTATSYKFDAGEDFTVTSYDTETGLIVLGHAVHYNHWGAAESTADTYNGVDIRGEVLILSRNIKIVGQDVESWGCQMVTSDTVEYDVQLDELKYRTGQMIVDNIEMYNCSQIDTFKASIRFENAVTLHSSVTNSAFHNGFGWGANIKNSANILMQDNLWFNFRPIGVAIDFSKNITFDNNVIAHIVERTTIEAGDGFVDKRAGLTVCKYLSELQVCADITVTDNIVAGASYAGFIAQGHNCGDYSSNAFKNNVAHSVAGNPRSGHGALIYPDLAKSSHETCFEGSYFTAYKCYYQGAYTYYKSQQVRFSFMNMIDNRQGFGAALQVTGDPEYNEIRIELNDNKIYGESPIQDCPQDGSFCKKFDKFGMMLTGASFAGKTAHITMSSSLPVHKIKSLASWGTVQQMHRNEFIGFNSQTSQGMRQRVFEMNEYQPDYLPMMEFFDSKFVDVKQDAVSYIMDPLPEWANLDDCGDYPCTAPKNALLSFQGTTFSGNKPLWATKDFQIISNNTEFSPYIEFCKPQKGMNAYVCEAEKMGVLLFESLDEDRQDRSMQPIYVKKQGTAMKNNLNAMMDHVWDGFYTGQKRLQRFPSIFQGESGSVYDVNFSGTPAKHMNFVLRSQTQSTGSTIRIAYPGAESRSIYVNGVLKEMNQWDDSKQQYGEIRQKFCGENRYIGVQNILEFYINTGCKVEIKPRNAIQTLVRMEWTLEAFFAKGGTTKFIDRLTSALGIHASTVKIVSVYEGSLIINYEIQVDDDDQDTLAAISENQKSLFDSGSIDLGAPILSYDQEVTTDASAASATYTPVTINSAEYNSSHSSEQNVFYPDVKTVTETQVIYKNTTTQVQIEPDTVIKTETVIVDGKDPDTKYVKEKNEKDSQGALIAAVALSVLGFIFIVFCIRYFFLKKYQERLDVERKIERTRDEKNKPQEMNQISEDKNFDTVAKFNEFEQQYDPNNDFAIFGVGDPTRGGIQDMQEKMNLADKPRVDSDSSEEEEEPRASARLSPTVLESKGSKGSDESTGNEGSHQKLVSNQLPEDKEIYSDDEK